MSQQSGPTVRPPVAPQVQEGSGGAGTEAWRPGGAVRVVPDLRQDSGPAVTAETQPEGPAPYIHAPVTPEVLGEDVRGLEKAEPRQEGGAVRVVPDLRQDPGAN